MDFCSFPHKMRVCFAPLLLLFLFLIPMVMHGANGQTPAASKPRTAPIKPSTLASATATSKPPAQPAIHTEGAKEKLPWWTYFASGFATVVGNGTLAVFAYFQFRRNYEQKERDLERQKNEFIKKQEADRKQFEDKAQADSRQFEEKAQEDRFKDIQDRFASTDDKTRANAALRLAEMARLSRPDAKEKPFCEENYPFFLRAVAPLAIALHMENDASVRAANKEALANVVTWVTKKEENDLLLRALVAKLYDANITAKKAFIKALAEYCNVQSAEKSELELLATVAPLTDNNSVTQRTLSSLMETYEFKANRAIHHKMHGLLPDELLKMTGLLLAQVKLDASRLMDTRDALAVTLRALSRPTNLPEHDAQRYDWFSYSKLFGIYLNEVFLASAELNGAQLFGVKLERAMLNEAKLNDAEFYGAQLNGTQLYRAQLNEANLTYADLTQVSLVDAQLTNAVLIGAKFNRANLKEAELVGVCMEDENGANKANFTDSNWREATFTNSDGTIRAWLWKWFIENCGTNEEKAQLASPVSKKEELAT